jgi:hypothetical protein
MGRRPRSDKGGLHQRGVLRTSRTVLVQSVTKKTQGFVGFLRPRLLVLLSHAP